MSTTKKPATFMPTDAPADILDELTELAHTLATEGKVDEAGLLTRVTTAIEALRKEIRQQKVMADYQAQCKTLAEDKLTQFLLS